ncbi:MAG: phytoene desaturase family protein [Aulosira sp. ZfuVER01]|nr:NAD(P)/FAD-dependent oxidoreductase [Aulosira sp. ZfuVER01]MDZ8002810.1 NAD(P)/FAD-dependent oxidoreductase [Aulosira sp. DedVER01a]MDZ8054372.1 NAD(P)/FAD-dependent oxidoreductase [Aulosira sp. ZfuCHP01]
MTNSNQYDAIVIGSGMGGLTVAAILSKFNHKKVLILEQHFVIGGYTHEFERDRKFKWDVGLHYVGNMGQGELGRTVFDYITDGKLQWSKMPDPFEKFVYPDFTFAQSSDPQKFQADLIEIFPEEQTAIIRYFSDVKNTAKVGTLSGLLGFWRKLFLPRVSKISRLTTKEYLDQNFDNPTLKALLASQWGDYGLPPSESSFVIHAILVYHYLRGGYYPVGGAAEIAKNIMPVIERNGGQALTQRQVTEIIIKDNVAKGVKVQKTHQSDAPIEEFYAPIIISDAGAFNTYTKLIPATVENKLVARYCKEIQEFPKPHSLFTLYLGFKESPAKLGFKGENYWLYSGYDHDRTFKEQSAAPHQGIKACYLSFASLKDSTQTAHTGQIIVFIDYDFFTKWHNQTWKRREQEYYKLKETIAHHLLDFVETHYPGFRELIEYSELSTPLTLEYFDQSYRGAVYGIPAVPARFNKKWISPKTPIKNLYLTGADAALFGIMGALMGGVSTAAVLNEPFGFSKLISNCFQESAQALKPKDNVTDKAMQPSS